MVLRVVRISRIGGIEVRLDPSLFVLVALVIWVFTAWFRADHDLPVVLAMAVTGAILVVLTTFAHELGHALEARHRGIEVVGITLLLFGGVTEMHAHGQTARDELAVAVVGPYVSLLCGALFGIIATFASDLMPAAVATPVGEVAGVLGWWNVLLAVFNLVPGAPLDGGRVLRALLWMALGDRMRALTISVRLGQVLGVALIGFGLWTLTRTLAAWVPALAFVVVGGFLIRAASSELTHARMDAAIDGRTVGELMGAPPAALAASQRLDTFDPTVHAGGTDLLPVTDGDVLIGVIEVAGLTALSAAERATRTAGELAEPLGEVPAVELDDDLHTLIDRFQGEHHVVRVTRDGRGIGALTEREVARALERLRRRRTGREPQPTVEAVS
jgi:Zn-dependent protease/predicted transcriptional regulator